MALISVRPEMAGTNSVQGCTDIFDGDKPLPILIDNGKKKEKSHFSFFLSITGKEPVYG